jgi:PKD repeat protein
MTLFAIAALLAVLLIFGGASAMGNNPVITVSDVTMTPGGTGTATVTLDQVPSQGLSGMKLYLTISDPLVADNVTLVQYNSLFGMFQTMATTPSWSSSLSTNPANTLPKGGFQSGYIKAMDLTQGSWVGGETNVVLATVTLHGLSAGTTTLDGTLDPLGLSGNAGQGGMNYVPNSTVVDGAIHVYGTPAAEFHFLPMSPLVGDTVTFYDDSTGGITSWDLDFGDGSAHASGPGPWTHPYTAANTYHATLIVNNPIGPSSSVTHDVVVTSEPVPVPDFTATPVIGVTSITPTFTGSSTGGTPTSWVWAYRASGTSDPWTPFTSSGQVITDQTFTAGAYDIRLTVSNTGGSNFVEKTQFLSVSAGPKRLTTVQTGTVSGDLYVGAFQTVPWGSQTSYVTNTFEQAFTIPTFTNVQWAKVYTVVYGSSTDARAGTATVSFDAAGDGTYETVLGTETLATTSTSAADVYPVNNHVDKQNLDYQIQYDVTSQITSATPKVKVVATPVASNFDARIKDVVLVVAYNDGDTDQVKYWVNDGHDYQANAPNSGIDTTFDTDALTSGFASATLQNVGLSSRDAAYNFTATAIPNTPGTSNPSFETNVWDVKSLLTTNLGSDSALNYKTAGGSFKTTLAALKVKYVVPPAITSFTTSKNPATKDQTVTFNAAATSTQPVTWDIDYGDGTMPHGTATGLTASWTHPYSAAGVYIPIVTATNEGGFSTRTLDNPVEGGQKIVDVPIITFVPATQTFLPGETRTYDIVMDRAPLGLAGYDMVVSLTNTAPADIVAVSYPSWVQMTLSPTLPADSVRIRGIDSNQQVWPGATNIVLATITVRGTADGTTPIAISSLNMDADGGSAITPVLTTGEAVIGTYSGPTAQFSALPTSGTGPLTVVFSDLSSGGNGAITTWDLDFGDGYAHASGPGPWTHDYLTVGTYTVKLTVTAPGGTDTETKTGYITVTDANVPVADFTAAPTSGNYPLTVTFSSALSTGNITSYAWDFDNNGVVDSYDPNPVKTYTIPGTYTVKLTVTGPGGSDTETKSDLIHATYAGPTAYFVGYPTSGLAPLDVTFSDQSTGAITGWHWVFGDGTTYDGQTPPIKTYSTGLWTVSLTVTGPGGSDTFTRTDYINAGGNLVAAFHGDPVSGFASRNHTMSVTFTDDSTGSPSSWLWNFGNGQTGSGATATTIYSGRPQKFTVSLDVGNGADTASMTKTQYITITPYLEAFPTYTNLPTDMNGDYVYEDINGNGRIDYDDVVAFYNNMSWIETNTDVDLENYDFNFNGAIDFDDVVVLNDKILYG